MKFSIIIPVYNIVAYIPQTLDSVLNAILHTENDVECICVDDGSTDGSGQVLDLFVQKSCIRLKSSFHIIHQQNVGVSAARNAALDIAIGDYICFVDGDDGIVEDYFEILTRVIEKSHADIIRFNSCDVVRLTDSVKSKQTNTDAFFDLSNQCDIQKAFASFIGTTWAWNACYRKTVLQGVRFTNIPNGEDILFASDAFLRAGSVYMSNHTLYKYRIREGSAVHTISSKHLISVCEMCKLLSQTFKNWESYSIVEKDLKRKLRNHLSGEVAARIFKLNKLQRETVWTSFFDVLDICAWSPFSSIIAKMRSKFLTYVFLVGNYNMRHWLFIFLNR